MLGSCGNNHRLKSYYSQCFFIVSNCNIYQTSILSAMSSGGGWSYYLIKHWLSQSLDILSNFHTNVTFVATDWHSYRIAKSLAYTINLWAGRSGDQIRAGTRFSTHIQTGPGVCSASYNEYQVSCLGINRSGHGITTHLHLQTRSMKE